MSKFDYLCGMNVLIVGLGKIAMVHMDALRSLVPDCRFYALRSSAKAPAVEGVTSIFNLDCDMPKFDMALISNPSGLHADAIENVLPLGIPLFIEKPLFVDLKRVDLINRLRSVPTYVGCNLRFLGCVNFMRDYIREHPEKRINEVNVYCGSFLPRYRGEGYAQSFNAVRALGGGVHLDLIHDIDYVCYMFGMPNSSLGVCRNASSLGIDAPDFAAYHLFYPGFTANVTLNFYRKTPVRRVEIIFDDEVMVMDLRNNIIYDNCGEVLYRGGDTVADTYKEQMRHFLDCIAKDGCTVNDADEAFEILKICLDYKMM